MLLKDKCICNLRHISDEELLASINEAEGIDELCERLRLDLCDKCKAKLMKRWEHLQNRRNDIFVLMEMAA